ncbi:hypothetical protein [Ralstonia mannitolilytica]|uniref:hypothetical protein n=1 Tax=Ralstonia mannitolilytica TaxID=105219 RepID=UPI000CEE509F|nr:hypothetical protein [Ralstonia mannitolilytica]
MEIDIARTTWTALKTLRSQIRAGARTGDVKEMEKLLTKGLADAISAELKRIEMFGEDMNGYDPIVTFELRVKKGWRTGQERPRKRLITELDDIVTVDTAKRFVGW